MPRYDYMCACGGAVVRVFAMREVPAVVACGGCGGEAGRVFGVPQVKSSSLLSEANKRGLAELDSTRRADETRYARNWDRPLPRL